MRILVYTDGEVIGDGIIRLPFIAALKHSAPEVHLTYVCSGYSVYENALKDIAQASIDELIILPSRKIPLLEYITGPRALARRRFDIIIDTQRNLKRAWWLSRVSHRRFISAAGNYLLSSSEPATTRAKRSIDQVLNLGTLALERPLNPLPITLPDPKWAVAARDYLPEGSVYIGFVIGAGHPDKCWKLEHFLTLAQEQYAAGNIPVFLLGPMETALAADIRAAMPGARIPLLDLPELAASPYFTIALGNALSACISNDSGGGHLIAAGGAPMVTLFRSDSVRTKFLPTASRVIGLAPEDFGLASMRDLPLDAVRGTLQQILYP